MKGFKKMFLLLVLPLVAFTAMHKYYMSVTTINYLEKEKSLQVTSIIFIDDFEKLLQERYGIKGALATPEEHKDVSIYIEKYLRKKFILKVNSKVVKFNFIGTEYDNDTMKCYLEFLNLDINKIENIEIENTILMDVFNEQQNIIHFKMNKKKKSMLLIREKNKGMLKL